MFTWICPKCGSEVPPSYNECPNCAKAQAQPAPETAQPAAQPAARPVQAAPPAHVKSGLPGWLVAVFVALALVAVGGGAYLYLLPSSRAKTEQPAQPAPFEAPTSAPAPKAKAHPLAKYIEIAGLRVTEDAKQKAQIKCSVVNHSGAVLGDLTLAITLKTSTAKPEDKPLAAFSVKVAALGPYEAKEVETTVKSALRAYELPDWQFLRAEFEITSPPAP